jgi:hypothetical protein
VFERADAQKLIDDFDDWFLAGRIHGGAACAVAVGAFDAFAASAVVSALVARGAGRVRVAARRAVVVGRHGVTTTTTRARMGPMDFCLKGGSMDIFHGIKHACYTYDLGPEIRVCDK